MSRLKFWNETTKTWESVGTQGPPGPPGADVPIGSILAWPGTAPPTGWLVCDGAAVDPAVYPLLAQVVSHTPDLRNNFIRGGAAPNMAQRGAESVQLTEANLPAHRHAIDHDHAPVTSGEDSPDHAHGFKGYSSTGFDSTGGGRVVSGDGAAVPATPSVNLSVAGASARHRHAVDILPFAGISGPGSGVAAPVATLPPHIVLLYIIKAAR
jgi:microcystin-dependent protein